MNLKYVVGTLGYMGLIPFIVPLWFVVNHQTLFELSPSRIFIVYSGVILTFLAGAVWGKIVTYYANTSAQSVESREPITLFSGARAEDLRPESSGLANTDVSVKDKQQRFYAQQVTGGNKGSQGLLSSFAIVTNLLAIIVWIVLITSDNDEFFALFVLLVGFTLALWVEIGLKLHAKDVPQSAYLTMRMKLTGIVCLCHVAMLFLVY
ncbi:DUF3429 domain-containing protein [Aliikangiella marina]|uniref:DUF3429 domain-containing protein n=1 Tax=Aliikangiella marina TaxID=1712262 RepID=A0A545T7H1_9GAMM|nr:DUF3429 domain-containing protein [Aliikangiella marina]TQV73166.1 DUF3429 domain-containing protein [Aliikangiella marina]